MAKNDDLWLDLQQSKHNHPEDGTIRDYGVCKRCDEWHRWHNRTTTNPASIVEQTKKRGRPKKDQGAQNADAP